GAVYVAFAWCFVHGAMQLLATGAGLLILLMVVPGGLGEVMFELRDRALRAIARRRGLSVPSLAETPDDAVEIVPSPTRKDLDRKLGAAIEATAVDASYGHVQVLFDVDVGVDDGEVVALLGTNG